MRIILIFFLLVSPCLLRAQELLTPLHWNPFQKEVPNQPLNRLMFRTAASGDTLSIPFFEDFSSSKLFPDTNKWLDRSVYINNNFPINPPSFNVATFDALDRNGNAYSYSNGDPYGLADTLTSRPINLSGREAGDSVYLSFFIEPMGNGVDSVQNRDSLLLDFYNQYGVWVRVWRTPGGGSTSKFRQIMIPVTDSNYLHAGFKFRLMNKTGLTGNLNHWHLDYINLGEFRTYSDTSYQDVTINHNPRSLLRSYRSLPWKQFKNHPDPASLVIDTLIIRVRNMDINSIQVRHSYAAYDKESNLLDKDSNDLNLNDDTARYRLKGFTIPLSLHEDSFNRITVKYKASSLGLDVHPTNDSLSQVQEFSNYIAYDDGNAEAGYTLSGPGKAALKFQLQKADTLKAIKIFFNQSEFDTRDKAFSLMVWSVLGANEKVRYRKEHTTPDISGSVNGFTTITLDTPQYISTAVYPNLTFYVGWQQLSASLVNVGFDMNYNELMPASQALNTNLLYNTFGSWQSSLLRGIPMIRPVFGGQVEDPLSVRPVVAKRPEAFHVNVFPNPVKDELHLDIAEAGNYEYQIMDVTGRMQPVKEVTAQSIDMAGLKAGIYFLKVTERQQMSSVFVKFVKQ